MADEKIPTIRGFTVEITDPVTGATELDATWDEVIGGGQVIEYEDGADKVPTSRPGRQHVDEITLRGAMTDKRAALCQWINDTVNGKPWKRTLTITELLNVDGDLKAGRRYIYFDCFPVGYVFPRMSATHTTGNVHEEVRIKPIRCELK
jgi:hypothetical protein